MFTLLLGFIYLSFIGLGLPDSLLGAAWPSMYQELGAALSSAGVISMIISAGTVVSSLQSDRMAKLLGTGRVTAISVGMTAVALFGFSISGSFWMLCLWAIPYGLGAGSVDAALNNYVALHYASRHMSWLHCMWGVGAAVGPYIMGAALTGGLGWRGGYRVISVIQMVLTALLLLSLPLWSKAGGVGGDKPASKAITLREVVAIPGALQNMITFFCYCALESTAGLWASSYLVLSRGIAPDTAAGYASLFYLGITVGRFICGFITMKFDDATMTRIGQGMIALGVLLLLLPLGNAVTLAALVMVGIGCAPIYPSCLHATPKRFGADKSQAIIGVQMASAYVGSCFMPPLFGLLAGASSTALYPYYLGVVLVLMVVMHEQVMRKTAK